MNAGEQRLVLDVGPARLLIGLAQGLAVYGLFEALDSYSGGREPWWLLSLMLLTVLVPTTVLAGITGLRSATLGAWIVFAVALVGGLAVHAAFRNDPPTADSIPLLFIWLTPALFVAYHLVAGADADRKPIANYATYFDIGWKNGVQLALSVVFVGVFWILLRLGSALFELINIGVVRGIIEERWFYIPATTGAFAVAVHASDVRAGIINGARALALTLMAWLLPVMAAFAVAFLVTLGFGGLQPLWATGNTTPLLLTSAIVLVLLINATYQDGADETARNVVFRTGARIAALVLAPLVAIAAYSLWLRIDQHGLSPDRVIGLACVAVAGCYAVGYAIAALWPGRWMKPLELTNVLSAFVALGLLIALLTPLADPAQIAVQDQVRRLQRGLVTPEAFDFNFLRFHAARYGKEALERLKADNSNPRAIAIAQKADEALKREHPTSAAVAEQSPQELLAKIVLPPGATLPATFLQQKWENSDWPLQCSREDCKGFFVDFDGDQQMEILLVGRFYTAAYKLSADNSWALLGRLETSGCGTTIDALRAGRFKTVAPTLADLDIDGKRFQLIRPCPPEPPAQPTPRN